MNNTDFEMTMQGLETGLQVQHIATLGQKLRTCQIDDKRDIATLFADRQFEGFDHIPVRKGSSIHGVISRENKGNIEENLQRLDESNLISAQEPLTRFIPLMVITPYRLVLQGASIQGIVTRSDLLKLPVRLFVFSLVTHLEILMSNIIRAKYPNSQDDYKWLEFLKSERQERVREKQQELTRGNYGLSLLESTDFCDKRDIVRKLGPFTGKFKKDFETIEKNLRDKVAHAGDYAHNDEEMKLFIERISLAEKWIKELQKNLTQIQVGNSSLNVGYRPPATGTPNIHQEVKEPRRHLGKRAPDHE